MGVTVTQLTPAEREAFVKATRPVYRNAARSIVIPANSSRTSSYGAIRTCSRCLCTSAGTHYIVDECMVELAEIDACVSGRPHDRDRVTRSRARALDHRPARPRRTHEHEHGVGLKTVAGFGADRGAVIDVGTNSVKFHVGERRTRRDGPEDGDRAEMTRLGEGLAGWG